jgi:hypothetical protein
LPAGALFIQYLLLQWEIMPQLANAVDKKQGIP